MMFVPAKHSPILRRPLALIGDTAYAATWLEIESAKPSLIVASYGGSGFKVFGPDGNAGLHAMSDLPVRTDLRHMADPAKRWSAKGVWEFSWRAVADPVHVFKSIKAALYTFIDFAGSFASQDELATLVAVYIMATYFSDAFTSVGYLWPTGLPGSGKSQLIDVITQIAYLGRLVLPGSSYPTLRDEADYGATLGFDEAESMATRQLDPFKRELLLSGHRKGAVSSVKVPHGRRAWESTYVNVYGPKVFASIEPPERVLASRCIVIPLVRSANDQIANSDPEDEDQWPVQPRRIIDDLWNLALTRLSEVRGHFRQLSGLVRGREFEAWRGSLAVARMIDREGGTNIEDTLRSVIAGYIGQVRDILPGTDDARLLVEALCKLISTKQPLSRVTISDKYDELYEFQVSEVSNAVNQLAHQYGLEETQNMQYIHDQKCGLMLNKLRVKQGVRTGGARRREITFGQLKRLADAYHVDMSDTSHSSQLVTAPAPPPLATTSVLPAAPVVPAAATQPWGMPADSQDPPPGKTVREEF